MILYCEGLIKENDWKKMYDCIMVGDPKLRTVRAISTTMTSRRKDL